MKKLLSFLGFIKKPQNTNDDNFNIMQFIIGPDGIPHIRVSISNTTNKDADFFGDFMHSLAIGSYNQSMLDILTSLSKEDDNIKKFITNALLFYNLHQTNFILGNDNNSKNKISPPLVRPTEFNKKIYE